VWNDADVRVGHDAPPAAVPNDKQIVAEIIFNVPAIKNAIPYWFVTAS
jgi:hypothetical protein